MGGGSGPTHFRRQFYGGLLPLMQEMGKTIFAISHDDHYFIHADRLLEMRNGQLSELNSRRDAASRDAVAGRHNITTLTWRILRQVNMLKIPSFLITL